MGTEYNGSADCLTKEEHLSEVLLLWIFYVFVLSCVCYVLCASVYMCFVVTCWERADLLALVCGVFCEFVTLPIGILGQVWYLIVSIPDLCNLITFSV